MRIRSWVWTLLCAAISPSQVLSQQPPNIVMIIADDMGWGDTSQGLTNLGHPSDFYETPTLERLASEGMAFTSAYATPSCASTRAMLMSGQYPTRATNRVYSVLGLSNGPALNAASHAGSTLTGAAVTLAETLKTAGYGTAHLGKWHIGSGTSGQQAQGFDEHFGGTTSGTPGNSYFASATGFNTLIDGDNSLDPYAGNYDQTYIDTNIKPFATGVSEASMNALDGTPKHATDAITDAFIDYVSTMANPNAPFYVNFAHWAPHTPIQTTQARDDLLAKYQAKNITDPSAIGDDELGYAALIEGMDQSIARVIDYLEKTDDPRGAEGAKLADNTLVIFMSDNGGQLTQANNGTLSGSKVSFQEGGIRVPLIAWSKNAALVDGETVVNDVVGLADFYRTFAELGGAAEPANYPLDGVSLAPLLADSAASLDRSLVFHFPGYNSWTNGASPDPETVIRRGDWKLFYFYADQSFQLFNLADDLDESNDVAASNPNVVAALGLEIIKFLKDTDAPLATKAGGSANLQINGLAYSDGTITLEGSRIYNNGQEFPFILPASLLTPGDFDLDGDIDEHDIDLLAMKEGSTDPVDLFLYDLDGNGMIEFFVSDTGIIASDSDVLIRDILGTQYGDANLDLEVELIDLDLLSQGWNGGGTGWFFGDFNGRDGIELGDLDILSQWFNTSTAMMSGAGSSPVPEPSSIVLLTLSGAILSLATTRFRSKGFWKCKSNP